jgi:hypothetical protein
MKNQTAVGRNGKRQEAVTMALEEEVAYLKGPSLLIQQEGPLL